MTEETTQMTVGEMLRLTGTNTAEFLKQVAEHIDVLNARIAELEAKLADNTPKE
jgi:hypothetical protein